MTHEREVIVPLDPAHEEEPALVERERMEREQAEKEENKLIQHEKEAGCRLSDESGPAEEGTKSEEDKKWEREEGWPASYPTT